MGCNTHALSAYQLCELLEQSCPWEADGHAASFRPCYLWNYDIHDRVFKSRVPLSSQTQTNVIYTSPSHFPLNLQFTVPFSPQSTIHRPIFPQSTLHRPIFSKIHSNDILAFISGSSKRRFPLRFPTYFMNLHVPLMLNTLPISHPNT